MDASTSPDAGPDPVHGAALQSADTPEQASPIAADPDEQPPKPATAPMQKRRRVTRACDECRRKKVELAVQNGEEWLTLGPDQM